MGGYYGHIVPGIVISFYGFYWVLLSLVSHFYEKNTRDKREGWTERTRNNKRLKRWRHAFENYSWLPFVCSPRLPVEPLGKIVLSAVGFFIEIFLELNAQGQFYWHVAQFTHHPVDPEKIQHATMYSFFFLSGIVDLVNMCQCCELPKKTGKVIFALAFFVEGSLFLLHTSSAAHSLVNVRVHNLIAVCALLCAIGAGLRVFKGREVFVNLFFSVSLLFQGTWLSQASFTLYIYRDLWAVNHHQDVMYISVIAMWHLLGAVVFALTMWFVVWVAFKCGPSCVVMLGTLLPEKWRRSSTRQTQEEDELKTMIEEQEDA